ncbi:hypothetical protein Q5P01_010847 [Channa striata]|uniref:Uncharacterized protein n=1 Tax=Channa striata TaxID=64152 RepID=A0AA88MVX0_CHASR|nr:hypothetical protein Q5P01_010847 [Channa striata]
MGLPSYSRRPPPHGAPLAVRAQTKSGEARPDLLPDRTVINTEMSRSLFHIPTVQQRSPQVPATVTLSLSQPPPRSSPLVP